MTDNLKCDICNHRQELYIYGNIVYCIDHIYLNSYMLLNSYMILNKYEKNKTNHKNSNHKINHKNSNHKSKYNYKCQVQDCNNMDAKFYKIEYNRIYKSMYLCIDHIDYIQLNERYCNHKEGIFNCFILNDRTKKNVYQVETLYNKYCSVHYNDYYTNLYITHVKDINTGRRVCYDKYCEEDNDHIISKNINSDIIVPKCNESKCPYISTYEDDTGLYYCKDHYNGNVCNYNNCNVVKNLIYKHRSYYCKEHLNIIGNIRRNIDHTGSDNEVSNRLKELKTRKDKDDVHIKYYIQLKSKQIKNKNKEIKI